MANYISTDTSVGADTVEVYKNNGVPQLFLKTDGSGNKSQIKFFDGSTEIATVRGGFASDKYLMFESGGTERMRFINSNIILPTLPTSDPAVSGALWNDSGTLKIS